MARKTKTIGVIEINTDQVEKDRSFKNAYVFCIKLSDEPDSLWKKYFQEEWKNSPYEMKREIRVIGNELRVLFIYGENVREHAKFAQQLVETTNRRIDDIIDR